MKRIAFILCLLVAIPAIAYAVNVPVCPKCHSQDLTMKNAPVVFPPDTEVPIDELYSFDGPTPSWYDTNTLEMTYTKVNWTCNKCNASGTIYR
jgi:hypothetical protein